MILRALIADDEASARRKVRSFLARNSQITIVGEASNGLEAVDAIQSLKPDLVFLDIQMPGMNGFEVIDAVGIDSMPAIVLITAFDKYAIEAFEVEAIDYLLKPVHEDRFDRALSRVLKRADTKERARNQLSRLLDRVHSSSLFLTRLVVRDGEKLFFVPVNQITRISAEGNYVRIHTATGFHMIRETISRIESRLNPEQFMRIHRSEIINIDYIKEIRTCSHSDCIVVLKNGVECSLSRCYKSRLLQ
jgi:two-component system, LytTR family, response regulator